MRQLHNERAYLENLETGDVEDADEVLFLVLRVESLVDASDQPVEHSYVDRLGQRGHGVDHLRKKGKGSPYSTAECRVPELIPVLGSQPAGDWSHKPGGRLPLHSA